MGHNLYLPFFSACGRTLQAATGEFSHKPNQQRTEEREVCEWRISATHGEKIVLNITSLDVPESRNCVTDYLEVRDGYYERSTKLGEFLIILLNRIFLKFNAFCLFLCK